jgi:hypothetical protein
VGLAILGMSLVLTEVLQPRDQWLTFISDELHSLLRALLLNKEEK